MKKKFALKKSLVKNSIALFDTTLRDGAQGEGISFSVEEMIEIAMLLDKMGIHYIEGGWPGTNENATEFFERMKSIELKNSKLCAFGSTRKKNIKTSEDCGLNDLLDSGAPVITIFGKSWDLHVEKVMSNTLDENLNMISESVAYLKSHNREVVYDAEHFFDGCKENYEYALKTLKAAYVSGADYIVLCDTNGGTMTEEIVTIVQDVRNFLGENVRLGIHAHNDCELAVANTLAAVRSGVDMVQGTINGYGERCGNANLVSVIVNLCLKMGCRVVSDECLGDLKSLSNLVSEIANMRPLNAQAFVGKSAFAHKGGVHTSAIMINPRAYEHIKPELIGNSRRNLVSVQSGKSNIRMKLHELGLIGNEKQVGKILKEVKKLESRGFAFELAEASLEVLMRRILGEKEKFKLISLLTDTEIVEGKSHDASAEVCMQIGDLRTYQSAYGNGPVDALDRAVKKALEDGFKEIARVKLVDYKVKVIGKNAGTSSKVSVLIRFQCGDMLWTTVGVSTDVVKATWRAFSDAYNYFLMK